MDINIYNLTQPGCYLIRMYTKDSTQYIETEGIDKGAPDIDLLAAFISLSMVTQLYGPGQRILMHINTSDMFSTIATPERLRRVNMGHNRLAWSRMLMHRDLHEVNWRIMTSDDPFIINTIRKMDRLISLRDNPPEWMC